MESHRHCKTVVIACVSPSVADASMTLGTLRYAVPIRIGNSNQPMLEPNPDNPATWSNEQLRNWVTKKSNNTVNPDVLCPYESGTQLLRLPETEFISRVMESNSSYGEKRAKAFYTSLWKLLIDARTSERKAKLKKKQKHFANTAEEASEDLEWIKKCEGEAINQQRDREWEQSTKAGVRKRYDIYHRLLEKGAKQANGTNKENE